MYVSVYPLIQGPSVYIYSLYYFIFIVYTISAKLNCLIDHIQLIRSRALHVINVHMHQVVAILSGKTNKVMKRNYMLLVFQHDFNICMNR